MSSVNANSGNVAVTTQAKYNVVLPTYADGNATELQSDSRGNLLVSINGLSSGVKGQQNMAGSFPVVIASDQSVIPSNQTQVNGVAVATGNGVAGNGVQRVAIASDNSNVPGNVAQINGVTPLMGAGNGGTGSLRVNIASDQLAIPVTQSVANWTQNVAQINGVTPLMGNGVTGTGSIRVTIASDNTVVPTNVSQMNGVAVSMGSGVNGTGVQRVTIATDQAALPVTPGKLSVQFNLDTKLFDASVTTINGSAGALVQVVASTTTACKQIKIADTTGSFIGVYTGAAAAEVFAFQINPGMDDIIEHAIAAGTRITIRAMAATSITVGNLIMQFQN